MPCAEHEKNGGDFTNINRMSAKPKIKSPEKLVSEWKPGITYGLLHRLVKGPHQPLELVAAHSSAPLYWVECFEHDRDCSLLPKLRWYWNLSPHRQWQPHHLRAADLSQFLMNLQVEWRQLGSRDSARVLCA
jgi:hypothetical protein